MSSRELLIIALSVFLTVGVLVLADFFKVAHTTKIPPAAQQYLKPIDVNIDESIFLVLKSRK